jgi:DNA helicase-2/ATP-dependent DNA helicase PcrA
LQDAARAGGRSLFAAVGSLGGAAGGKLAVFVQLVARMRADTLSLPLTDVVEHLIERSGLVAHYRNEREGQDRIENLRELVNAAAGFLAEEGISRDLPANAGVAGEADLSAAAQAGVQVLDADAPGAVRITPLAAFLAHASLEAGENQAGEGSDAVQLMTVHSAKGLEFDAVFITGLEEGLFPHENSIAEDEGLEEERRLMYVAITRARRRLHLSFSQTRMLHGQTRYSLRSRFFDELPAGLLKWLTPQVRPSAATGYREGWGGAWEGFGRGGGSGGRAHGDCDNGRLSSAEQRAAQRFDRGVAFRVGQNVAHARFGEGVIVSIEGSGDDARVQVNFGREGVKWLALSVARLEAIG